MNIGNIMTHDVITMDRKKGLLDASKLMSKHNIGSIVVMDEKKICGILTDRDIVLHLAKNGFVDANVEKAMSTDVKTLTSYDSIEDLIELMGYMQIRRVPIVDNGNLTGIICLSDLIKNRYNHLATDALSEITNETPNVMDNRQKNQKKDDFFDYM